VFGKTGKTITVTQFYFHIIKYFLMPLPAKFWVRSEASSLTTEDVTMHYLITAVAHLRRP
jgi:hypothetical protein